MSAPRRRSLLRLFLLGLLALSVVWVLRVRRQQPNPTGPNQLGPGAGFGQTSRLVFQSGGASGYRDAGFGGPGDSLVVVRLGDEYWVTHPFHDRGDIEFLSEVRRRADNLRPVRVLPDTVGGPYGLTTPRSRLTLVGSSGARWSVALGDSSPVGSAVYARTSSTGSRVVLLDRYTADRYFRADPALIRDRIAAQLHGGPVDSILVRTRGGELCARRLRDESWKARFPAGLDLDPVRVNQVLVAMRGPAIQGYPPPTTPLSSLGLDPPRAVWVLFQGSRAESIRIGNPSPDQKSVYILPAGRSLPARMESDFFRTLVDGWSAMADRHLVGVKPESLQVIEFLGEPGAGSYRYEKKRWRRYPSGRPVPDPEALDDQVRNLSLLQWRSYPLTESPPGRDRPRLRLRLVGPARTDTLILAAPRDSIGLARSSRRPRWGEVSAYTWRIWRYRCDHPE